MKNSSLFDIPNFCNMQIFAVTIEVFIFRYPANICEQRIVLLTKYNPRGTKKFQASTNSWLWVSTICPYTLYFYILKPQQKSINLILLMSFFPNCNVTWNRSILAIFKSNQIYRFYLHFYINTKHMTYII